MQITYIVAAETVDRDGWLAQATRPYQLGSRLVTTPITVHHTVTQTKCKKSVLDSVSYMMQFLHEADPRDAKKCVARRNYAKQA